MTRLFASQLHGGDVPKLFVDKREQLLGRRRIVRVDLREYVRNVTHIGHHTAPARERGTAAQQRLIQKGAG
jgi:hypothetical protein